MDETRLRAADQAYETGDWTMAAREYLAAAAGHSEGAGYAFHRAGNALMKLKRVDDACAVYERALGDPGYSDNAAVARNLGTAKMSLGAVDEAAKAFERSLALTPDGSRYKALQGLGGALYQMGRVEDAAEAYRQAALDKTNPDQGKALNNLGLCFVALDRPEDAVEAYRAAVDLPDYPGRGRAAANLGMAYAALGMHDRAVASFEQARDEFGYEFPASVEAAYKASGAARTTVGRVEGWSTGEMDAVESAPHAAGMVPADEEDDSRFFTITDDEMRVVDREARKRDRSVRRERKPVWVSVLVWAAVAVLVAGALVGAYLAGFGYPTQQMTVNGVLGAYGAGESVDSYWVAVPASDVDKAMASLPPAWESYTIGAVERSARTSKVDVTIVHEQGGQITYQFSLAREGVGWKVNGVVTAFNSMEGGL